MKFCSDFGSCYRGAADGSPPHSEMGTPSSSSIPESSGVGSRRRRMTRSKSGSSSSSWRPKLAAISEDSVVRAAEEIKGGKREGGGGSSRKRSATETSRRSMGRPHSFSHADESIYRHSSISMAIPAFSPTPFMF